MTLLRQLFLFVFFIVIVIPSNDAYADAAAVILNIPCDETIIEEFDKWEKSPEINRIFNTIIRINGSNGSNLPVKETIIEKLHQLHNQEPLTIFYFIFGLSNNEEKLIDYNRVEINEELFVINDEYIAPNIVIIDLTRSFSKFTYELLPESKIVNFYRTYLKPKFTISDLRHNLMTTPKPLSIKFFSENFFMSITPVTQNTRPFIFGPIPDNSQMYFMTEIIPDLDTFVEEKFIINQILSQNDFKQSTAYQIPYPALNVISIKFRSPFFYAFSEQNGNSFDIFDKWSRKKVLSYSISGLPTQYDLNSLSYEYTNSRITAMAFPLPDYRLGLFQMKNNEPQFVELDCMKHNIEAMTIDLVNWDESLIYIHNYALRYRVLHNNRSTSIQEDKIIYQHKKFTNMSGAKLIWRNPNAVILSKERGLFYNASANHLRDLYYHRNIYVHYVDTFMSGNGEQFGFVWSGSEKRSGDNIVHVEIGIESKERKQIMRFDITKHIQSVMVNPKPSISSTPKLFLKDKTERFTKLLGAMIYLSNDRKTVVKNVEICLRSNCFNNDPVKVTKTKLFPKTNMQYNIKALDPEGKKLIVYFDYDLRDEAAKGYQLFSFY